MSKFKHILAMDENSGLILSADERGIVRAIVGGKAYRTDDFRPVDGDGRQLRADNQETIKRLMPIASAELQKVVNATKNSENTTNNNAYITELVEKLEKVTTYAESLTKQNAELMEKLKTQQKDEPIKHESFNRIKAGLLDAAELKRYPYMIGPSGTGKSYLAKQIAEALGVRFYQVGGVVDAITQLTGYTDANGNYVKTEFYRAWKDGGLILFDEFDSSVPEALVLINNALSNGYFTFPDAAGGTLEKNERCYIIAAGNTTGRGADSEYTGRYALDVATLDRFFPVVCKYDRKIELKLANGDTELVDFIHDYRAAVKRANISALATYRAINSVIKFQSYGDDIAHALRFGLTGTLPADDVKIIAENIPQTNKYAKALTAVVEILTEEEKD